MKSYDDPAKRISRDRLREFIKTNLLSVRNPKDVKVLCFPGAEQEGQEAVEVKEVYDPLGIPRENIVGLEMDPFRAVRLWKAGLGIEVAINNDLAYLSTTSRRFDIINLDYVGTKSRDVLASLKEIASRQILTHLSILAIGNCARRENYATQDFLSYSSVLFDQSKKLTEHICRHGEDYEPFAKIRDVFSGGIEKVPQLPEARDDFTLTLMRELVAGRSAKGDGWYYNAVLGRNPKITGATITKATATDPMALSDERNAEAFMQRIRLTASYVDHPNLQVVKADGSLCDDETNKTFLMNLYPAMDLAYIVKSVERYKYVSNSGTPMDVDMVCAFQPLMVYQTIQSCLRSEEVDGRQRLSVYVPMAREFIKGLKAMRAKFMPFAQIMRDGLPERAHLGSSYERTQSLEEITTGGSVPSMDSVQEKPQETSRDPINKKEAIILLSAGYSPKEIADCYSSFTKGQLRAFKAHLTMGKYRSGTAR